MAEGSAATLIAPMSRFLARACGKFGRAEEGLALLAQEIARKRGDGADANGIGDLYRLKGELLLIQDSANAAVAEECFHTAIKFNRGQSAKWWELLAATNLARLLKQQGRLEEARAMLAEIYNWFTVDFDTADLKDAKALLDELAK